MTTLVALERDYNLTTFEGWRALVEDIPRSRPAEVAADDLATMGAMEKLRYNEERAVWHANLGPYRTPAMLAAIDEIDIIVESNRQDGDKVRSSAVLDAAPGLGKTTLAVDYAKVFHRKQIALYGPTTPRGSDRIPVAYIRLSGKTTMRSVNAMLCAFYGHPAADRGNATELGRRAAACAAETATRLIVIDDIHFMDPATRDGRDLANHLKWLANDFPATFLFVGVGIEERGLLGEGLGVAQLHMAQIARRWTRSTLLPFDLQDDEGRAMWLSLLLAIELDIVLANKERGMVATELYEYLFARSTGHFASLMALVARGCRRAVQTGEERLTIELMNTVKNDGAAEAARRGLEASLAHRVQRRAASA